MLPDRGLNQPQTEEVPRYIEEDNEPGEHVQVPGNRVSAVQF